MRNLLNDSVSFGSYHVRLCKRGACKEPHRLKYLTDLAAARTWLQLFKQDDSAVRLIRSILSGEARSLPLSRMMDDPILEQFALLLSDGIWHVHAVPYPLATKKAAVEPDKPVPKPAPGPAPTPKPTPPPRVKKCITQITATLHGTRGKRDSSKKRPTDTLRPSSSSDESLSSNPPVILVRGCHQVKLRSVTTPAHEPVTWSIKPNENTNSAPALTPADGGKSAILKSNKAGSFSVIGELDGCKVVWNVVFAWVKVDTATGTITKRKKFADAGSGGGTCNFSSGSFSAGNYAWEGTVKLKVLGGGKDEKLGINKIKVKILQNGIRDTLSGNYESGGVALEVPKGKAPGGPVLPVVDANDSSQPFVYYSNSSKVTPNSGTNRTWWTGDSPAGSFLTSHLTTHKKLTSISGVNGFRTAVASVSDDALNSIVVHAKTDWAADFSGSVDASGNYTPTTADVTGDSTFALISNATGGQDACDAGFETFEPRFNGGTDTKWTP